MGDLYKKILKTGKILRNDRPDVCLDSKKSILVLIVQMLYLHFKE